MIKKHIVLIGITLSTILLVIAAFYYPGGSQADKNSVGYDWKNNYLCNFFTPQAVNGMDNPSRPWAIAGMFLLCMSFAIFFIGFSKKAPTRSFAVVIKYAGAGAMLFAFLVITPYHDLMVTIAVTLAMVALFYLTILMFRSKLFFFKVWSIISLAVLYFGNYIYNTKNLLNILPIIQKVCFLVVIVWFLGLEYYSKKEDFIRSKPDKAL